MGSGECLLQHTINEKCFLRKTKLRYIPLSLAQTFPISQVAPLNSSTASMLVFLYKSVPILKFRS